MWGNKVMIFAIVEITGKDVATYINGHVNGIVTSGIFLRNVQKSLVSL